MSVCTRNLQIFDAECEIHTRSEQVDPCLPRRTDLLSRHPRISSRCRNLGLDRKRSCFTFSYFIASLCSHWHRSDVYVRTRDRTRTGRPLGAFNLAANDVQADRHTRRAGNQWTGQLLAWRPHTKPAWRLPDWTKCRQLGYFKAATISDQTGTWAVLETR